MTERIRHATRHAKRQGLSGWLSAGVGATLALVLLAACSMDNHQDLPRNMKLTAFEPHRPSFTCIHEADHVPAYPSEAQHHFDPAQAAIYRGKFKDQRGYPLAVKLWTQAAELDHSDVSTTMIYTHVLKVATGQTANPLDSMTSGLGMIAMWRGAGTPAHGRLRPTNYLQSGGDFRCNPGLNLPNAASG